MTSNQRQQPSQRPKEVRAMNDQEARDQQVRDVVEGHRDASGAIPAGEVQSLIDSLCAALDHAYAQGLEDAQ